MNKKEHLQSLKNEFNYKVLSIYERCTNIEQKDYLIKNEITKYKAKLIEFNLQESDINKNWTKIKDSEVINIWVKSKDDDCEYDTKLVEINPDWYQENGTPMCSCGMDLVYSHTKILSA